MADILIIDDDADFRRFVAEALAAAGHETSEAKNGIAGVAAYHARRPALVITDIVMSGRIETIYELRRAAPDLQILAVSGNICPDFHLQSAEIAGANVALEKSFDAFELLDIVEQLLAPSQPPAIALAA